MDKQKEMQKMQQEIFDNCAWRFGEHPEDYREVANNVGEDLYYLGYRNCKDKVVLTKEEYDDYINLKELLDKGYFTSENRVAIHKAHKETASEILDMGNKLYKMSSHKGNAILRLMDWIKVEYGIDIGEENV